MPYTRVCLLGALLLALAAARATPSIAQISVKATPYSFRSNAATEPPTVTFSAHRLPVQAAPAFEPVENGFLLIPPAQPLREVGVDLGFDNAGVWQDLPGGGRLWRLRIAAEGAAALGLVYDDFWMPPGARFFLYDDDRSVVRGAFTEQNNKLHRGFATDYVPGEATILEYYEPAGVPAGRLHVSTVLLSNGARQAQHTASGPYVPTALSCSINVACQEGQAWGNEINAVVRISNGCTGVLLNNTRADQTPYVLTANHCGSPVVGDTLNWVFEFNYQSATCANPAQTPVGKTISGAVVRAASNSTADFTLLELLEPIPSSFNVHYAGWSIENTTPSSGVLIGHPRGDIKKITIENDPIQTINGTSWLAQFDRGTVEIGSSGAPLFNQNHQFIGHVRAAFQLDQNACSGPGGDDNNPLIMLPKLSYAWNTGVAGRRISDFLDPLASGSTNVPPLRGSGTGSPAPIWINEINAHGSGTPQADEFIEVVGSAGTNLNNYKIDVYNCSGGTPTLRASHTIGNVILHQDYGEFGVFLIAGPAGSVPGADQRFSGAGTDVLPDGYGLVVLKNPSGAEVFDYQYDTKTAGLPDHCPASRTTRSVGDPAGSGTMGFTISSNPTSTDTGWAGLNATPGEHNLDGGQELPVELVSFDAVLDGDAVLLRWQTASETNNAFFEIHSRFGRPNLENGEDGWDMLGFEKGHGTTLERQAYQYRVEGLQAGTYRFRLKQVDYDGSFAYSPEVEVAVGLPTTYHLTSAYPNPFNPETAFSLSVSQAQRVEVAVYDLMGRRVALLHEGLLEAQSTRSFRFEAHDLSSGLYLIRAVGERFVASQTITLIK